MLVDFLNNNSYNNSTYILGHYSFTFKFTEINLKGIFMVDTSVVMNQGFRLHLFK